MPPDASAAPTARSSPLQFIAPPRRYADCQQVLAGTACFAVLGKPWAGAASRAVVVQDRAVFDVAAAHPRGQRCLETNRSLRNQFPRARQTRLKLGNQRQIEG